MYTFEMKFCVVSYVKIWSPVIWKVAQYPTSASGHVSNENFFSIASFHYYHVLDENVNRTQWFNMDKCKRKYQYVVPRVNMGTFQMSFDTVLKSKYGHVPD